LLAPPHFAVARRGAHYPIGMKDSPDSGDAADASSPVYLEAVGRVNLVYLEAVGVVIVLLSLVWAAVSWRRYVASIRPARSRAGTTTAKGTKHRSGQTRRARMMERMEERWRRRQEGKGGMPGRTGS
jgi:hypothetical protein